jgi:isopentenyldiphosphate isomerase
MPPEERILKEVERFDDRLPHFPDGRIDYHTSDTAPVVVVFAEHEGKYLLLKRSENVRTYHGKWDCVAGYLDEVRPVREKVLEELVEEAGIAEGAVERMAFGEIIEFGDEEIGLTWIIQPVKAVLRALPEITINSEHTEYRWVAPEDFSQFDTTPDFKRAYEAVKDL